VEIHSTAQNNVIPGDPPTSKFHASNYWNYSNDHNATKTASISSKFGGAGGQNPARDTSPKKCEIPSIRRAVEFFNVPHPTLRDRLEGRVAQPELYNQNLRLIKTQEEALVE
jgi:hypothetical protein